MYIRCHDTFSNIKQMLPAQPGWRACFAYRDFSDYVLFPVIAWVYGDKAKDEPSSDETPIFGGLVYAFDPGGETVLAPENDHFLCYLSPDDSLEDETLLQILQERLDFMKEELPKMHEEENKAMPAEELDARAKRLRLHRRTPIEIDF